MVTNFWSIRCVLQYEITIIQHAKRPSPPSVMAGACMNWNPGIRKAITPASLWASPDKIGFEILWDFTSISTLEPNKMDDDNDLQARRAQCPTTLHRGHFVARSLPARLSVAVEWQGGGKTRSEWRRWLLAKQLLSDVSSGDCYIGTFEEKTLRLLNVDTQTAQHMANGITHNICDFLFVFTNKWIVVCNTSF